MIFWSWTLTYIGRVLYSQNKSFGLVYLVIIYIDYATLKDNMSLFDIVILNARQQGFHIMWSYKII